MATPAGAEHRDLEQRIRDLEQRQRDLTTSLLRRQPIQSETVQYDLNVTALPPGTYAEVTAARQTIAVPVGFTRAQVLLFVSAGATFTGSGNVGVQPRVQFGAGPAIANGVGAGPVSVSSFMARNLFDLDQVETFELALWAAATGTVNDGSGNVHLSAAVTFLR